MAYIPIDLTKPLGIELQAMADLGATSIAKLNMLYGVMTQMVVGVDYSAIETHFGTPAGTGQQVFELLENAITDVNNAANIQASMTAFAGRLRQLAPIPE